MFLLFSAEFNNRPKNIVSEFLFPLESGEKFVLSAKSKEEKSDEFTYQLNDKIYLRKSGGGAIYSNSFESKLDFDIKVLPNGIYFKPYINAEGKNATYLAWMTFRNSEDNTIKLQEVLNPFLCHIIDSNTKNLYKIACLDASSSKIFTYDVSKSYNKNVILKDSKCIYQCGSNVTVHDFVSTELHGIKKLAIYLNTGEIKIGSLVEDKFVETVTLSGFKPNANSKLTFSSATNELINYSDTHLRAWNINLASDYKQFNAISLLTHFKISQSGRYLSGIVKADNNKSKQICVMDIEKNYATYILPTEDNLDDVMIGADEDILCYASEGLYVPFATPDEFAKKAINLEKVDEDYVPAVNFHY